MLEPIATLTVPDAAAPPVADSSASASFDPTCKLAFTGSGKEYFRIWIVNLLLTVATLGIYSAWAKVRRLQYFDRNTQLAGASFDFCGNPLAILKGRLLAVALLGLYHYAFGFSLAFGVVVAGALALALPFLMRGALRFRSANTRYRGLAFGFAGSVGGAYLAYLPPVATVLLPGAAFALAPRSPLAFLAFLPYLCWPVMHGAMKRYQHRHITYGDQQSRYELSAWRFVRPYAMSLLFLVSGMVGLFGVTIVVGMMVTALARNSPWGALAIWMAITIGYLLMLLLIPYFQVRVTNLAWSNTSFPHLRIRSEMKVWPFMRLQVVNTLLTLLTLGLYRPFAVVRVYQYRLAHLTLEVDQDFEQVAASAAQGRTNAAGDGAADFLGVDISW